jgi:uncharacterized protein YbaA (DUF1428 family)
MPKNNSATTKPRGRYVDGFVINVPKRRIKDYVQMAKKAGKIWKEYGALEFRECMGEDLNIKIGMPYLKLTKAKKGETVFFSWIVYKSKSHRDQVNAKVMSDPRLDMDSKKMPFDVSKMSYGGFEVVVNE